MGYTHGKKWEHEEIKKMILKVVSDENLGRMPSKAEIEEFYGDTGLSNAVSRHGGFRKYADELGLTLKDSETRLGEKYERICRSEIYDYTGLKSEVTSVRFPYDLLVEHAVKIDVKSGRLFKGKAGIYYTFNLEKKQQTCDIYVCYCISEDNEVAKTYVIPAYVLSGKTQLSVGKDESIYDKYIGNWKIINRYYEFISNEI